MADKAQNRLGHGRPGFALWKMPHPRQYLAFIATARDFASTWLPHVLQSFNRAHPRASTELKVGITSELLQHKRLGQLDLVFGKQCARGDDEGELL